MSRQRLILAVGGAVAVAAGAPHAAAQPFFFGLQHQPMANTQLTPIAGGGLRVQGPAGATGGVSILGPIIAEYQLISLRGSSFQEMQPGGGVEFVARIDQGNPDPEPAVTLRMTRMASFFDVFTDFSDLGATSTRVLFRSGNAVVDAADYASPSTPPGSISIAAIDPDIFVRCDPIWAMFPMIPPLPVPPFPPDPPFLMGAWSIVEFSQPVQARLGGGATMNIDEIIVIGDLGRGFPPVNEVTVDLRFMGVPFVDIQTEALGAIHYPHTALGQARFADGPAALGGLRLMNLGDTGMDGVRVELLAAEPDPEPYRMDWARITPQPFPPGTFMRFSATGIVGQMNQLLGTLTTEHTGNQLTITPDYSPIGSQTTRLVIFNNGMMVGSFPGITGPVARVPIDQWPTGCGKIAPRPPFPFPCFIERWPFPIPILPAGLPTPIMGDEIRVLAEFTSGPLGRLTTFSLQTRNIPDVIIVNELLGDPCPTDWDGSGTVNSSDVSAFLTAWIASLTQGNLIADFNGDGTVNSADVSAFLTRWIADILGGACA